MSATRCIGVGTAELLFPEEKFPFFLDRQHSRPAYFGRLFFAFKTAGIPAGA
jgi:hypothetical protein